MSLRALCLFSLLLALVPASASAAQPSLLWQSPEDAIAGAEAGQIGSPQSLAVDRSSGHVFVGDFRNRRINEFDVWGQFVKAWGWGVADGSAELQACGPGASPPTASCQQGIVSLGPGAITSPRGLAVDAAGNVYVDEMLAETGVFGELNGRIQKFDSEGNFLWMIGGGVDKTTGANICTAADLAGGDECGAGELRSEDRAFQYIEPAIGGDGIEVAPDGTLLAGDVERIQEFSQSGEFLGDIPFPGKTISALAVNAEEKLFLTFGQNETQLLPDVRTFERDGTQLPLTFDVPGPLALALSPEGPFYVVNEKVSQNEIFKFAPDGTRLIPDEAEAEADEAFNLASAVPGIAASSGTACGIEGEALYAGTVIDATHSALRAFGSTPDPSLCPPPPAAPSIVDQYLVSATTDSAQLRAEVNPHFWPDTRYYVEYGTTPCSAGGCSSRQPLGAGALLTEETANAPLRSAPVVLSSLQPDTTYHYRFVAQSSGGGPVSGVGGTEASAGAEGTFTTARKVQPPAADSCPNAALRTGASALLPDCRAYEMVSPVDKNGGDIEVGGEDLELSSFDKAAISGEALTFSASRAFAGSQSSPYSAQYLSRRSGLGWQTEPISPPRDKTLLEILGTADTPYDYFSDDLCRAWLLHDSSNLLAPGAVAGFSNIYERDNCEPEAGSYTAVTTVKPLVSPSKHYEPELQGFSTDGLHTVFAVKSPLTNETPALLGKESRLVYDAVGTKLRFLCILPNGLPTSNGCSAGTAGNNKDNTRHYTVQHAVSADGSRIYWTDARFGAGPIYLRVNGKTTIAVSGPVSPSPARFLDATPDGAAALFLFTDGAAEGDLYRFDAAKQASTLIAEDVGGILGASEDLSRIYLAKGGDLYFYERDSASPLRLIGTLAPTDLVTASGIAFSPLSPDPSVHTARVTADGLAAVFASSASLTGFDNREVESGRPATEVFHYDATAGELHCVSCSPTGARPRGRLFPGSIGVTVSGNIRTSEKQLYNQRVLAADGRRLFFESLDRLVPQDVNQVQDVYQWEAPGEGSCTLASPAYYAGAGGCLSLISSGQGATDSRFVDASPSGDDAFFATEASLVAGDAGLVDIYDARVRGGFAPAAAATPCSGEACQPRSAPPAAALPASAGSRGEGNLKQAKKPRCPKKKAAAGRHAGKRQGRRCAKKRAHRHHHRGAKR